MTLNVYFGTTKRSFVNTADTCAPSRSHKRRGSLISHNNVNLSPNVNANPNLDPLAVSSCAVLTARTVFLPSDIQTLHCGLEHRCRSQHSGRAVALHHGVAISVLGRRAIFDGVPLLRLL